MINLNVNLEMKKTFCFISAIYSKFKKNGNFYKSDYFIILILILLLLFNFRGESLVL